MEQKTSLLELSHSISVSFRDLASAREELDLALENLNQIRSRIGDVKVRVNATLVNALGYFGSHPEKTGSEEYHGICRLADDAGFESLAEQLRSLQSGGT